MSKLKNVNKAIIKWVSYGFFVLLAALLILTFGVPSMNQNQGQNRSTLAVVNGQSVSTYDFVHFMNTDNRFAGRTNEINADENMRQYVISLFIKRILNIQYAEKIGIKAPKAAVLSYIRSIPFFQTEDGEFSSEQMDNYLAHFNMSFEQFYEKTRQVVLLSELNNLIVHGAGVSPDEILLQKTVQGSNIQIEYAFVSNDEIRKRYPDRITVSDSEVDAEMEESEDESEDPAQTRASVKTRLEREKLSRIKIELAGTISKGSVYESALETLNAGTKLSKNFRIGDPVYEDSDENTMLYELYSDQSFYEDCLGAEIGTTAKPVVASNGVYVYTVREKVVHVPELASITEMDKGRALNESFGVTQNELLNSFYESSKVVRNYQNQ